MIIRASSSPGEIRAVACDAHGLLDYAIERPGAPDGVGDLHRGRITARLPALAAVLTGAVETEAVYGPTARPVARRKGLRLLAPTWERARRAA